METAIEMPMSPHNFIAQCPTDHHQRTTSSLINIPKMVYTNLQRSVPNTTQPSKRNNHNKNTINNNNNKQKSHNLHRWTFRKSKNKPWNKNRRRRSCLAQNREL